MCSVVELLTWKTPFVIEEIAWLLSAQACELLTSARAKQNSHCRKLTMTTKVVVCKRGIQSEGRAGARLFTPRNKNGQKIQND
jgi:hypothetical protein